MTKSTLGKVQNWCTVAVVSGRRVQLVRDGGEGEGEEDARASSACCLPGVPTPHRWTGNEITLKLELS